MRYFKTLTEREERFLVYVEECGVGIIETDGSMDVCGSVDAEEERIIAELEQELAENNIESFEEIEDLDSI